MARAGPRKIAKYGDQFKATAVKLSSLRGVLIQDVAVGLDIHPFMLSLWRKQVRDGVIVAKAAKPDAREAWFYLITAIGRAPVAADVGWQIGNSI